MTPTKSSYARNTIMTSVCVLIFSEFSVFSGAHGSSSNGDNNTDTATTSRDSLHSKGLRDVKVYCLLILLVSTFVAGISPYYLRCNESFLILGTQFAAGIFLGTAMMHFLGDSNSTFADLTTKTYPFAFMLACVGYLFTMFSDCVIQWIVSKGESPTSRVDVDVEEGDGTKTMELPPDFLKTTNVGDTVLLIIALCFHSVFEGIAVGVSGTKADAWRNLWTINLHKIFAAVSMGIALLKMQPNRPFFTTSAYALAFAISSPVGVGIGIAIDATTQGAVADWIFSISMAIAAGVFVYVAINHLIAKGFRPTQPSNFDTPFYKFLAVLLGVAVISVVLIWD